MDIALSDEEQPTTSGLLQGWRDEYIPFIRISIELKYRLDDIIELLYLSSTVYFQSAFALGGRL